MCRREGGGAGNKSRRSTLPARFYLKTPKPIFTVPSIIFHSLSLVYGPLSPTYAEKASAGILPFGVPILIQKKIQNIKAST